MTGDEPTPTTAFGVEAAAWEPCGDGLQCGHVPVPLDHDEPSGATLEIGLVRVPATAASRGSIFVNPGGPGASGVGYVRDGFRLDPETSVHYDLIGFDPRGVGSSGTLACEQRRGSGRLPDLSPDDDEERLMLDADAARFAAVCEELDGAVLPHLDTDSVARDLDLLREAVGDVELHYLGFSYGTLIGQVYAGIFPERIGHLVLDGVIDPTFTLPELLDQQAAAFNDAFLRLDASCGNDLECPDGGVLANHDALVDELERQDSTAPIGSTELEAAALQALYDDKRWPRYVRALDRAVAGDYGEIDELSRRFFTTVSFASYAAVICSDASRPVGPEAWTRFENELASSHARFGAVLANELRPCAHWPIEPKPTRSPITASGSKPLLVIGTTNDPATPLINAIVAAETLDRASLVVYDGDRHTAYNASACVRAVVRDYFVDDLLPEEKLDC